MSSDTLPFPVISLADLSAGNLQKLGDDVVRACHDHGFLYIKDTGIPDALVDKMWDLSFKMFEGMSEDEKKKYTQDHNQLGYKVGYFLEWEGLQLCRGQVVTRHDAWNECLPRFVRPAYALLLPTFPACL